MRYYLGIVTEELIDFWIDSTKQQYEILQESNSLFVMQDALRNLSFKLAMFRTQIFISAKDRAVEIVKAKGISIPDTFSSLDEVKFSVFPRLGEAVNLVKEIIPNLNSLFERFFSVARENINEYFSQSLKEIENIEKNIDKSVSDISKLDALSNKLKHYKINLNTVIQENNFSGLDLWNHFKTFLHAGENAGNELTDKFPKDYKLKYMEMEINLLNLREQKPIEDDFVEKKSEFFKKIIEISSKIISIKRNTQYHSAILDVISKLDPGFPINLQRLSELADIQMHITERTLKEVLELYPKIGKYDPMSQMLVFDKPDTVKKKTKKPKKKVKCPDCDSEIKSTLTKCPNCGKEFDICYICRGIITTERTKSCSSCGRIFHKNHLEEWMNTNSNCPVCKDKL